MKKWWMESIGYQIYLKSFYDTNNDGIGDINGIKEKLKYLKDLGIDLIWICPFYDSPMDDNGYDVRDFREVSKDFGTLNDFKELVEESKKLGIRIILDFVLNHTSDEHEWFIESRKSKDNPFRDYYIWQEGKMIDGKEYPPTNWGSFFGGSAWKKDELTNSYYMKIFSNKMPDLNWENNKVREEMIMIGKWWLDLGIDGFRIDAVSHLSKDKFDDSILKKEVVLDWNKFSNLPKVHDYLKEMNEELFLKYDALAIGEVGGAASITSGLEYSAFKRNELSMVFNFDHNWCNNLNEIKDYKDLKVNLRQLKKVFMDWQDAFKDSGWLPLNWLNHDQPRLMSQYGNMKFFNESAKMLATSLYLMRGTPFIYQGEEIGMTNYPFIKYEELRDVSSINFYNSLNSLTEEERMFEVSKTSRDNPRTPMQWNDTKYAGFSKHHPWINVNPNYHEINVEKNLSDEHSIWHFYKKLLHLRKKSQYKETLIYGIYQQYDLIDEDLYIYKREDKNNIIFVISSFSDEKKQYQLNDYLVEEILLSNYQENTINESLIQLKPYEVVVLKVRRKE